MKPADFLKMVKQNRSERTYELLSKEITDGCELTDEELWELLERKEAEVDAEESENLSPLNANFNSHSSI